MPPAQRHRPSCRRVLIGSTLAFALVACGPRVRPVPLDGDADTPAPPPLVTADEPPPPAADTLTEEALPEITAPEPVVGPPAASAS